eukprot:TRINITY_DN469_c0_g2_i2.p1 TRINITY_DN469_c0_g2~~TRINITY_DN469_c0_g2_i2.p1  ORF type:complete len:479 (-),score=225.96 TRINITY_DN469_c0_g2_i2:126-1526(-)
MNSKPIKSILKTDGEKSKNTNRAKITAEGSVEQDELKPKRLQRRGTRYFKPSNNQEAKVTINQINEEYYVTNVDSENDKEFQQFAQQLLSNSNSNSNKKITKANIEQFKIEEEQKLQLLAEKNQNSRLIDEENLNLPEININHVLREERVKLGTQLVEARSVDEVINQLSSNTNQQIDKHPEKRRQAAFLEFEEKKLIQYKQEFPTLKRSQLKEMVWKEWQKSPLNPVYSANINSTSNSISNSNSNSNSNININIINSTNINDSVILNKDIINNSINNDNLIQNEINDDNDKHFSISSTTSSFTSNTNSFISTCSSNTSSNANNSDNDVNTIKHSNLNSTNKSTISIPSSTNNTINSNTSNSNTSQLTDSDLISRTANTNSNLIISSKAHSIDEPLIRVNSANYDDFKKNNNSNSNSKENNDSTNNNSNKSLKNPKTSFLQKSRSFTFNQQKHNDSTHKNQKCTIS